MSANEAQQVYGIRRMDVIPLQPRALDKLGTEELIHRDCFVRDTRIPLGKVMSTFKDSARVLGEKLAKIMHSDTIFPMQMLRMPKTNKISLSGGDKGQIVRHFDLSDSTTAPMTRFNLDFAFVEMLTLPPIGDMYSMNTATGGEAAVCIPLAGAATIKSMMGNPPVVKMNPFSAAIIRPQTHIFMRGAYAMLIRPKVA